jgi:phospho-N-acetylmuramoyl-pentapeptide-transferase
MNNYLPVILAFVISVVLSAVLTGRLIPFLKKHQFAQFTKEIGPTWHQVKNGTPSMGGIAILTATVVTGLVIAAIFHVLTIGMVCVAITMIAFSLIGFLDDYEKAIKKNNNGLSAKQKLVLQFVFGLAFAIMAYFFSGNFIADGTTQQFASHSAIWIPIWDHYIELGIFYIPWVMFIMTAFSNSVNLTDGLDGLASSVTALVALFMAVLAQGLSISDSAVFYAAVSGACVGFLFHNHYPAKVFMGDTGSMALGSAIAACAIMMKMEFILAIAGFIYIMESGSVIIQVAYFKKTHGKRIFRMSPIHHHFELGGMHETKVVRMFVTLTLIFCIIAFGVSLI